MNPGCLLQAPIFELQLPRGRDAVSCVSEAASDLTGNTRGTAATMGRVRYGPTQAFLVGKEAVKQHHEDHFREYGGYADSGG
jgi:hypothetical protein